MKNEVRTRTKIQKTKKQTLSRDRTLVSRFSLYNDLRFKPFGHDNSHNPMVLVVGICLLHSTVSTTQHYLSVCVSHMASMMSRSCGSNPICWTDSSTSVCPVRASIHQPSFLVCSRVQSWGPSCSCFTQRICFGWSGATSFNLTLMPMTPKSAASSIRWQPLVLSVECHPVLMKSPVG